MAYLAEKYAYTQLTSLKPTMLGNPTLHTIFIHVNQGPCGAGPRKVSKMDGGLTM